MKDTQTKSVSPTPKTKPGLKKAKMTAKKLKEPKLPLPKVSKGKKNQNSLDKKPKTIKEDSKDAPRKKRGRPRNEDKAPTKKQAKGSKTECKPSRKRKLPQNGALSNERNSHPPSKKLKISDISVTMNGNAKMPSSVHKPIIPKIPSILPHTVTNNCSNGGTSLSKKSVEFPMDKPAINTVSKTVTFHPNTKSEVLNGNGTLAKPFKSHPASTKSVKSILKNETVAIQPKENSISSPKEVKNERLNNPSPTKLHPQRMASLDALAKMHVICIPDRKPVEHHSKATTSVVTMCSEPFTTKKSMTQCHERIQFDVKKESKDSKGNLVHKQINYVKEKQQVFVSHSVEQSKTVSTIDQEKVKKSTHKLTNSASGKDAKSNQNVSKSLSKASAKGEKTKTKVKDPDKKSAKSQNKAVTKGNKKSSVDGKLVTKGCSKKTKKVEQTKSEVKVKETIRMRKTCTYQSVTTVNSHGTANASVVPVSHVGLTTNYSKTKKTVVTDEECKNKMNYSSGSVVNNSFCVTSESPCAVAHHSDYYKFHAHSSPPLIPFAHLQTCALGHGLNRTSDSSTSSAASHCDGNFAVHRFGHQQAVIYSPSADCSCCCSNSLVQNLHDSCLLRKSIVAYPHSHHPPGGFSPEPLCPDYNPSLDLSHHRSPPPASHFSPSCCCDPHHLSPYRHMPSPKSAVPSCEQSPLDLSLASSNSSGGLEPQSHHCPGSPLCCAGAREVLLVRAASTPCCRGVGECAAASAQQAAAKGAASEMAVGNFLPAKREKSISPKQSPLKVPVPKKKQFAHGWSWKGKPREKMIALTNDSTPCPRMCYPSVQHEEGDIINEKDCVLLRSGPKETDLPYVAKVAAFWENPEDGEMMMSLLWYYRPEHTDQGRKPGQMEDEVFASRHKDVNSIACIEDKCYVLTYNEYCRYRASLTMDEDTYSIASMLVPEPSEGYPRKSRLPLDPVSSDIVFVCRYVYDFRQKRTLKNPT